MAVAFDIVDVENSQKSIVKTGILTFSGNYVSGGDTLDLTAATSVARIEGFQFRSNPRFGAILKGAIGGYVLELIKGSGLTNWLVKVYESGADGGDLDEIAAAGVPSGLTDNDADLFIQFTEPVK